MVQKINTSDDRLLVALRSANLAERDEALRYIYEQHYEVIANFILKNSGSDQDAEDTFQDTMVTFYKQVQFGELQLNCSIRTYLYAICRNLWLKQLQKRKRSPQLVGEWEENIALETPDSGIDEEQKAVLASLLDEMGEGCRNLLVLYFYERMRMRDIAERMNLANEGVVKNKKLRCMKKLQKLVSESAIFKAVFGND